MRWRLDKIFLDGNLNPPSRGALEKVLHICRPKQDTGHRVRGPKMLNLVPCFDMQQYQQACHQLLQRRTRFSLRHSPSRRSDPRPSCPIPCAPWYTLDGQNRIKGSQNKRVLAPWQHGKGLKGAPVVSPVYVVEGDKEGQLKVNSSWMEEERKSHLCDELNCQEGREGGREGKGSNKNGSLGCRGQGGATSHYSPGLNLTNF